jgi:hypothetical protein
MEVVYLSDPFPHAIIRNYFDEKELHKVWREIELFTDEQKLDDESKTGSGQYEDGSYKKKNHGVFLDFAFSKRTYSDILTIMRKTFSPEITKYLSDNHWVFKYMQHSTGDTTLLSYYEDGGRYDKHFDYCSITTLTHLFREPKQFEGGELVFEDYNNYVIPMENNRMILFPSIMDHTVTPMTMKQENKFNGNGRYVLSQFISIS